MAKMVECLLVRLPEVLAEHACEWRLVAVVARHDSPVMGGFEHLSHLRGFEIRELYFERWETEAKMPEEKVP